MNKVFVIFLSLAFILGQFARFEFGNGVALVAIDVVVGTISVYWLSAYLLLRKKLSSSFVLPILVFTAVAVQSLIMSLIWFEPIQVAVGGLYLMRFLSYVCLYFVFRDFTTGEKFFLIKVLLVVITTTLLIGVFQYFYYPSLRNLFYLGWDDHLYRLFSVFLDPNFTGALFVCFLLFLLLFLNHFKKYSNLQKTGLVLLVSMNVLSIFLTYSRTALIMLIGGGVIYLLLIKRTKLVFAFLFLIVVMLLSTVDVKIEGLNPFRTVSSNARLNSVAVATDIFSKHPILGVGFNTYRYAQNHYGYRTTGTWQTSHADAGTDNSFLFVLVTTGVVGFIAYLFFWYRILSSVVQKVKKGDYFAKLTLATILALFIGAFFLNILFYPFIMAWYFMILGLTENTSR